MKATSLMALVVLVFTPSCASSSKKVRDNWPRVPTKSVAVGAAAAAALLTLADPSSAGRKESAGDKDKKKTATRGQPMPASVLDRLDEDGRSAKADSRSEPCGASGVASPGTAQQGVPLVPTVTRTRPGCPQRETVDEPRSP